MIPSVLLKHGSQKWCRRSIQRELCSVLKRTMWFVNSTPHIRPIRQEDHLLLLLSGFLQFPSSFVSRWVFLPTLIPHVVTCRMTACTVNTASEGLVEFWSCRVRDVWVAACVCVCVQFSLQFVARDVKLFSHTCVWTWRNCVQTATEMKRETWQPFRSPLQR